MVDGLNENIGCYVQRGKVQTLLLGNPSAGAKDECPQAQTCQMLVLSRPRIPIVFVEGNTIPTINTTVLAP